MALFFIASSLWFVFFVPFFPFPLPVVPLCSSFPLSTLPLLHSTFPAVTGCLSQKRLPIAQSNCPDSQVGNQGLESLMLELWDSVEETQSGSPRCRAACPGPFHHMIRPQHLSQVQHCCQRWHLLYSESLSAQGPRGDGGDRVTKGLVRTVPTLRGCGQGNVVRPSLMKT